MIEINSEEEEELRRFKDYLYIDQTVWQTLIRDDAPQAAKDAFYAYREKHKDDPDDEEY